MKDPSPQTYISIGLILTGGTMFTTWLGDMITDRGIGNGISMIIMAGIIARVPDGIRQVFVEEFQGFSDLTGNRFYILSSM